MQQINILEPSVKSLLLSLGFNGKEMALGTGFIVQAPCGYVLITNRHNVTGKDNRTGELLSKTGGIPNQVSIWHNLKGRLGQWIKLVEPLLESDRPLWIEHPVLGEHADVVALPLTQTKGIDFYPYDLDWKSSLQQLMPSDILSVVGFPYGLSTGGRLAIWATGFVASEPSLPLPTFLIDCRTRQGQSGSAVIAQRNGGAYPTVGGGVAVGGGAITEFLGIYSGRVNVDSDIGLVWKASIIKELIESIGK